MTTRLEDLDPPYAKSMALTLSLARPLDERRANKEIGVLITLTGKALETGLVLPLVLTVTAPRVATRGRAPAVTYFRRTVPESFSFTPREGGEHLVTLAEVNHNLFWGALVIDVAGDQLTNESA